MKDFKSEIEKNNYKKNLKKYKWKKDYNVWIVFEFFNIENTFT